MAQAKPNKATRKALDRVERRRRELEARLDGVRTAIEREIGWAPRTRNWILPLLAFAGGLALAGVLAARRRAKTSDG